MIRVKWVVAVCRMLTVASNTDDALCVQDWQKGGEDKGSTVGALPSDATIMGWASELLGIVN